MSRFSSASKLVSAASASCGWFLQGSLASASAASCASGVRSLATKLEVVPREEPQVALNPAGLPPAWIPPPSNPQSLHPRAQPSPQEVLAIIRQAATPLDVHNAFRRRPSRLPPAVAAAKFARLSELLRADPACLASSSSASSSASEQPQQASTGAKLRDPAYLKSHVPGLGQAVREIGGSWDAFLHLYPAGDLAACVRAAAETGLILSSRELGPAATAAPEEGGASSSSGASSGSASAPAPAAAAAAGSASGAAGRGLLQRSLDVLLDRGGQELAAAGPQAVLDLAYGLMLIGHVRPETWQVLRPLLGKAAAGGQLAAGGGKEQAAVVVAWLQAAGVKA
ncbi:hypothetical protein HXX76_007924 [Chlamydomonas incerta]|uniref:Uncharacterized protein n=1 Tax=Chlamydomonas incerta TaxID=51695 RepID=A0A835SW60_CHLIN|nr:hypothetical protein HXX76_007924 [Chlamydomonas incerta]|eukprot:KAG2434198.1 hypothetical protein HXX76_007924 [Chlamydomonas incerta]